MSWSDEPVRPLGIPLNSPLTWLVAALAAAVVAVLRRGGRDLRAAGACTGGVLPIAAMAASVALLLGSFAAAPVRLAGTYTLAAQNLESIRATSCGLQDHVQVLPEIPGGVLRPAVGSTAARGFVPGGGFRPDRPPPSASGATRYSWGSRSAGPGATGKLTTAWFPLPELAADQEVAVRLSGRPEQGNTLALEFARRTGEAPEVLGDRRLVDPAPTDRPFDDPVRGRDEDWRDYSDWRSLAVPAGSVPAGADLVRVRAVDGSTDEQGWLAVSGPAVREVVGLTDFLARRGPVLIAWPMSFAFPCRTDFPVVRGGLAQTPGVILGAPRSYPEPDLSYDPEIGGTFAGVRLQSGLVEVPSRLAGRPGDDWGQVLLVAYRGVRDDYQVETTRERRAGWEGEGAYPFD
jgi:arabinosyltransferase C